MILKAPLIKAVPEKTFYRWLKNKGKLGGQNKVPRLSNSRKHIDEIITKETIAKELWGSEWQDKYSEWAISKLISELRKKIKPFQSYNIKTMHNKGFLCRITRT